MAKTMRDANLGSRAARSQLKPADKPYYRTVDEGLHIGYRRNQVGGKWVMRSYAGKQAYKVETIGMADDVLDADGATVLSFHQAQAVARRRFVGDRRAAEGLPAEVGAYTVAQCIREYVAWLEHHRKSAADARVRAEALILPKLGGQECSKLTTKQLRTWHEALAQAPARVRTKAGAEQRYRQAQAADDPEEERRRRRATANRTLTTLKAALNKAWKERRVASDDAWRPVTPFREADAARVRYLSIPETKRLIEATVPAFRPLVQAALLTGCRYSELTRLQAIDFGADSGTLHVQRSKGRKGRHVVLTDEGQAFFRRLCKGRKAGEPLLPGPAGSRWQKSQQARPMREACRLAGLEPPVSFHVLRHTYCSLSVMNGVPLLVIARNLGQADTRMVEKHYGHLSQSYLADAIRAAVPTFGIVLE